MSVSPVFTAATTCLTSSVRRRHILGRRENLAATEKYVAWLEANNLPPVRVDLWRGKLPGVGDGHIGIAARASTSLRSHQERFLATGRSKKLREYAAD